MQDRLRFSVLYGSSILHDQHPVCHRTDDAGDGLVTAKDGNGQVLDGLTTLNNAFNTSISDAKDKLQATDGLATAVGNGVETVAEPFDEQW